MLIGQLFIVEDQATNQVLVALQKNLAGNSGPFSTDRRFDNDRTQIANLFGRQLGIQLNSNRYTYRAILERDQVQAEILLGNEVFARMFVVVGADQGTNVIRFVRFK